MTTCRRALAVLLAGLLVAGPGLAQDEDIDIDEILDAKDDMPEGDFDMPDGDFDIRDDEPAKEEEPEEEEPPPPKKQEPPPKKESPPAKEDFFVDNLPKKEPLQRPQRPVAEPKPRPRLEPQGPEPTRPVGAVRNETMVIPPDEPEEAEGGDSIVWVATGVGTGVGVLALVALGVGGYFLLNAPAGPTGTLTVNPR